MNDIPSPFVEDLYNIKPLLFMEVKPHSDTYQQLVFSESQLRRIRDFISLQILPQSDKDDCFIVTTNDSVEIVIPNSKDSYTEEELKNL